MDKIKERFDLANRLKESAPEFVHLNAEEAASFLNINVRYLHKLCRKNSGPKSMKVGYRLRLFRASDVLSWAEQQARC